MPELGLNLGLSVPPHSKIAFIHNTGVINAASPVLATLSYP